MREKAICHDAPGGSRAEPPRPQTTPCERAHEMRMRIFYIRGGKDLNIYRKREDEIKEAMDEARRFIERARETLKVIGLDDPYHYWNKEHAAMKRASLDLSNALIKLRKPI